MVARKYFPIPCRICGELFTPVIETQTMCSRKCSGVSQRGEQHYLYATGEYGPGRYKDAKGYISVHVGNKTIREHRLVAEKALGKPLPPNAQVHHIDGDRTNNSPDNLVICQDTAYHKLLHRNQEIVNAGGAPGEHLICGSCKKLLPLDSFNRVKRNTAREGRSWECRECEKIRWARNKEALKQ